MSDVSEDDGILLGLEVDRLEAQAKEQLIDGSLSPMQIVMDGLLDLRNLTDDPDYLARIDLALANVPGRSLVKYEWYTEQLSDIRRLGDSDPTIPASPVAAGV